MITYGVFCRDVLIFSDKMTYAIYDNENSAESFMCEMQSRFNRSDYSVRSIELNVKVPPREESVRQQNPVEHHIKSALSSIEFAISTGSFIRIDKDDIMSIGMEILTDTLPLVKESLEKACIVLEMRTRDRGDTRRCTKEESCEVKISGLKHHHMWNITKTLPKEDLHFCCKALRAAASVVRRSQIVLEIEGYESDVCGESWYGRCPYCTSLLVLNKNGLFPTWRKTI